MRLNKVEEKCHVLGSKYTNIKPPSLEITLPTKVTFLSTKLMNEALT